MCLVRACQRRELREVRWDKAHDRASASSLGTLVTVNGKANGFTNARFLSSLHCFVRNSCLQSRCIVVKAVGLLAGGMFAPRIIMLARRIIVRTYIRVWKRDRSRRVNYHVIVGWKRLQPPRANFFFGTTLDLVSATKCFLHECACADQANCVYAHEFHGC